MAVDTSFATFAAGQDAALRAGMDNVIQASITTMLPVGRILLVIFVAVSLALFSAGRLGGNALIGRVIRGLAIVYFIGAASVYDASIRDVAFDHIPTAFATAINGGGVTITAGQQFDIVSTAADNLVAEVRKKNTGWSASAISNSIAAWIADAGLQFVFLVIAAMWLLGRKLMALVLCFGPWLAWFELFDRTRGWVDQWLGKIVGLLVFQLAADSLMQISMQGEMQLLRTAQAQVTAAGSDEALGLLFHIFAWIGTDALAMLVLPTICAIGSGAAAGHAAAAMFAMGAPGRAANFARRAVRRIPTGAGRGNAINEGA